MGQLISGGWTLEQSDALKNHIGAGATYNEAAQAINLQFGTSFSRNAAIGKANRLGLACVKRPPRERQPRQRGPRKQTTSVRIIRSNGNSNSMRVVSTVNIEQMRLRCVEIIPLNLTLAEIGEDQCRYIAGEEYLYCGHPKMSGSSYCTPHHHLVWEKPRSRKDKSWNRSAA
jgi:GcrA cell cycle regulator